MFGNSTFNKPGGAPFNTPGSSVFGQSGGFGTTSLFGTQTPAASNTLFGNTASTTTAQPGGIFGGAATTGFGQTNTQTAFGGFGQTQPAQPQTGGLFGNSGQQSTGLFSTPSTATASNFGTKTPSTGFGTSLFGATSTSTAPAGGLFGSTSTSTASTGGLFGTTPAASNFGAVTNTQAGTTVKFNPPNGQDTMLKSGVTTNINTRHQCITAMKEYEDKSIEELRMDDYTANRKGPQPGSTGLFNQTTQASTGFTGFGQQNKGFGGFGQTSSATSAAGSLFSQPQQATSGGGLFGATNTSKPLFGGTTTTTASSGFGGFGNTAGSTMFGGTQNKTTGGLFGNKPTAFGQPSTGTSLFGQNNLTTGFAQVSSAPSAAGSLFSQPQQATSGTGLFGATNTSKPLFGGPATTAASTGFGNFGNASGSTMFGATPSLGTAGLFGKQTTGFGQPTSNTGLTFGQTASTSLFGNKPVGQATTGFNFAQTATNTNFPGSIVLGPTGALGQNTVTNNILSQSSAAANQAQDAQIQQQLLSLSNSPYGDSPLFRNLKENITKRDDLLKPTNPVAQKAALAAGNQYKVSPRPTAKIKPKPLHALISSKSQLFDGLEDEESSFGNDTFVPRRSVKKLVIKNNDSLSNTSFSKQSSHADPAELDQSQALPSPEESSKHDDRSKLPTSLATETEDLSRNGLSKEHPERNNIATGLFKNVNESFLNDTISDFNPRSRLGASLEISRGDSSTGEGDTHSQTSETPPTPHPAGIVLRRPGYHIVPSLEELGTRIDANGDCIVENLVIGREGYGNVMFPGLTNVANMNLDEIVFFRRKEITIYPEDSKKPDEGTALNKKAQVTLDCVWPSDKTTRDYIKEPSRLRDLQYQDKLERATAKIGAKFLDYRPETGSWVFEVKHFSKYGLLDDSDDEDDANLDPKKLKLLKQQQQQQLAVQKQQIKQIPGQPAPPVQGQEVTQGQGYPYVQGDGHPEPVAMEQVPQSRPLFSDEEDLDDLMEEGMPKEMGEIDDDELEVAPSSHRLAHRLGVMAEELQLRKASFFGDEEEDMMPKWKSDLSQAPTGLFQAGPATDRYGAPQEHAKATEHPWSSPKSLLATSFSKQTLRQISPPKKPRLHPGGLSFGGAPFSMMESAASKQSEHILIPSSLPLTTKARPVAATRIKRKIPALQESLFADKQHVIMDAGLVQAQKYRVGWGSDLQLVHAGKALMSTEESSPERKSQQFVLLQHKGSVERSRLGTDSQQLTMEQMYISQSENRDETRTQITDVLEDHLRLQLDHSRLSVEDGCPQAVSQLGNKIIQPLVDCSQNAHRTLNGLPDAELYQQANLVWELCQALWGDLTNLPTDDARPDSYAHHFARREAFSDWLTEAVAETVDKDIENIKVDSGEEAALIYQYLTGHQLQEACVIAQQNGDHRVALLIAQASGSDMCRGMVHKQLTMWNQSQMDDFIEEDRLRIYALLSGNLVWMTSGGLKVNTCQDLDWKRALAMHLWYQCPPSATVSEALSAYNQSHSTDDAYSAPPLPNYCESMSMRLEDVPQKSDVCFHLLQLYSDRSHPLHGLLCPTSATPNYLDFRLSWQLSQVLQALEYTHLSEYHTALLCTSFSTQLERVGLWQWAVFVLLHITDHRHRQHAVKQVLQRHVRYNPSPEEQTREDFLQASLKVPASWIHQAKAIHAGHCGMREEEVWHWLRAGHWNTAHQLILKHLASSAIVNECFGDLKSLLCELGSAEVSRNIEDWDKGGQVFLDYITMMETLEQLQQSEPSPFELEKLQTEVSQLSKRITGLECHTATDRLCKSEMAKKAANLMRMLLEMKDEEGINDLLVTETSELPLPEDYALQELHQLTRSYLVAVATS